mgnify:CR=1 FL=1
MIIYHFHSHLQKHMKKLAKNSKSCVVLLAANNKHLREL